MVHSSEWKREITWEFIRKYKYGNTFDYSKVKYIHSKKPVIIICKIHGEFLQRPNDHLCGKNCNNCGKIKKTKTTKQFIKEANKIHNNFYNYSLVKYKKSRQKSNYYLSFSWRISTNSERTFKIWLL